ncbi:hypothetical protein [Pantoea dispersa]|uniref:hypothetical protein n=1 Tax=Pantoea dispersa TaxID=59814 RepID=UPI0021F7ED71|nr:hypothetical protein [Pantoea dispersa]UYP72646.1 hypothetical protein OF384_15170 [Pantoea dispersa]
MEITKKFILDGLARFDLSNLPGRPFDNAFELLAAPPARKRLIMLGFNGSAVDAHMSNASSIIKDYEEPDVSNVVKGTQGSWGITHLAKRLQQIPASLGYNWQDVVYTNALMMCSENAASLKQEAIKHHQTMEELIKNSMSFFEEVTLALCHPELIIAHSNGLSSLSAASLLLKHFGDKDTLMYSHPKGYFTTFGFVGRFNDKSVPVVCVRHMSRFKPQEEYIKAAISQMHELVQAEMRSA